MVVCSDECAAADLDVLSSHPQAAGESEKPEDEDKHKGSKKGDESETSAGM
jgi:hypothetical protein